MIDKHHFISKKGVMALTFSAALCASMTAQAETIEVKKFKYAGPFPVSLPWMADSVDTVSYTHLTLPTILLV